MGHPARFSPEDIDALEPILKEIGLPVFDCFGGTGERLGQLCDRISLEFSGVELEPEWITDSRIRPGDATRADVYPSGPYVLCTSPVFPSGMTDHFAAKDGSRRYTYRQGLAAVTGYDRPLHASNMGQYGPRRGKRAEAMHWNIADRCVPHWPDVAVVNVSNSIMGGKEYPTVACWRALLGRHGFTVIDEVEVRTRRNLDSPNRQRAEFEVILIAKKPGRREVPSYRPPRLRASEAISGGGRSSFDPNRREHLDMPLNAGEVARMKEALERHRQAISDHVVRAEAEGVAVARKGLADIARTRQQHKAAGKPWPELGVSGPRPLALAGQRRMARARLAAGVPLSARDLEALKRDDDG
jgi:hypothetical protein